MLCGVHFGTNNKCMAFCMLIADTAQVCMLTAERQYDMCLVEFVDSELDLLTF